MTEVDMKAYDKVLNDYHLELSNAASLSAHLLDLGIDNSSQPEWYRSACFMMRDRLTELAEALPFPGQHSQGD